MVGTCFRKVSISMKIVSILAFKDQYRVGISFENNKVFYRLSFDLISAMVLDWTRICFVGFSFVLRIFDGHLAI